MMPIAAGRRSCPSTNVGAALKPPPRFENRGSELLLDPVVRFPFGYRRALRNGRGVGRAGRHRRPRIR
jgi:hypothetical protein